MFFYYLVSQSMAGSKCEKRKNVALAGRSCKGRLEPLSCRPRPNKEADFVDRYLTLYLLLAAGQFSTSLWSLRAKKGVVKVLK